MTYPNDTPDGGPAFPVQDASKWQAHGMTLRDYFAAKALAGHMANKANPMHFQPEHDAKWAYRIADAMLEARQA